MSTNRDLSQMAPGVRDERVLSKPHETYSSAWDKPTRIMNALVRCRVDTTNRDLSDKELSLQLASYAERLKAWPTTDVERVLTDWPRRNKFWPSWAELEAELPDLKAARPVFMLPEHRPIPSREREEAEMRKPFETRQQWLDFSAALARLRDPNVPHLAREVLLRIGESIEARQLPHAQAQGWA